VTPDDHERILEVWEESVRATHDFLGENDIELLRPLVLNGLLTLSHFLGVRDERGDMVAFLGMQDEQLEALFVHPAWRGRGIGRRLTTHAVELGATRVDVNEQNEQAVGFYRRLGFEVRGRSPRDGLGLPFPLLHMRLSESGLRG
jgi:putative acetyltransferase